MRTLVSEPGKSAARVTPRHSSIAEIALHRLKTSRKRHSTTSIIDTFNINTVHHFFSFRFWDICVDNLDF